MTAGPGPDQGDLLSRPGSVVVLGLGFGDEGKGATVDYLAASGRYTAVVRFNGGSQAAHTVVLPDGTTHTFAQFGSGTLRGLPTILSEHMLVEPFSLLNEAEGLTRVGVPRPLDGLTIDPAALLTTPYHWKLNQARERARGVAAHGTTGRGIGETTRYALAVPDAPRVGDLTHRAQLRARLQRLRDWAEAELPGCTRSIDLEALVDDYRALGDTLPIQPTEIPGPVIFEGAQGVLLDQTWGFPPHNTWTDCTAAHALDLASAAGIEEVTVLGLLRAYATRHGAGPLPTEWVDAPYPEPHNRSDGAQGRWRAGHLDLLLLRYALAVAQVDGLVLNHLDQVEERELGDVPVATGYRLGDDHYDALMTEPPTVKDTTLLNWAVPEYHRVDPAELPGLVEQRTGVPVVLTGHGPTAEDRRTRDGASVAW